MPRSKSRKGGTRKPSARRTIPQRIAELEERIAELKKLEEQKDQFSPEAVRSERERLDLTAAEYADLVGVSMITIYSWENARSRPRPRQLEAWTATLDLSKEEAWERLGIEELSTGGFSPEAVFAERERLGLSAKRYADLLGVSMLSVYNWEKGRAFPREAQIERWKEIKGISKREAHKRLGLS